MSNNITSPTSPPSGSTSDPDKTEALIQIVLTIPNATIHHIPGPSSKKKLIGHGELRIYSSTRPYSLGSTVGAETKAPSTTFMTLETNSTSSKSHKSLITHPLMPRSTAEKTGNRTWRFSVPGQGYLELDLPETSEEDIASFENLLTDRMIYTNQYSLRNQLALVDDVGQIFGILDKDEAEMDDDDNVSLSENAKSPVVVEAFEPKDDDDGKPLRLKVSIPSADDMADYLTSTSQYFGESLVKGATVVAGGIASSSTYLNSKIPETQKPLKISPFIKNRIRNVAKVSRVTFGLTGRLKSAIINKTLSTGFKALKYWTAKDDSESYSTMQNIAYSILTSAGVLIQAAEESINIVTGPAISATTDLAGRALGPDVQELVSEAMESFRNFTLVYFDRSGVSRRAFLRTSRVAALQTAQEVKEGKIKMRERTKNPSEHIQGSIPFVASAGAAATQVKELIFSYFGKTEEQPSDKAGGSSSSSSSSSDEEGSSSKKPTSAAADASSSKDKKTKID